MTNRQVPETIMTRNTTNISNICQFGWYDWVMFHDNIPSFPDAKARLGQYPGPAIDVGSMLTAKYDPDWTVRLQINTVITYRQGMQKQCP